MLCSFCDLNYVYKKYAFMYFIFKISKYIFKIYSRKISYAKVGLILNHIIVGFFFLIQL